MRRESTADFFEKPTAASLAKTRIVSKYFASWANVMKGNARPQRNQKLPWFAYIDLYAGPGRYNDRTPSTPLKVLEHAATDQILRENLAIFFNEGKLTRFEALRREVSDFVICGSGIEENWASSGGTEKIENAVSLLRHAPIVRNFKVGPDIRNEVVQFGQIPTLSFLDPFGIKGLELSLIQKLIGGWGCDCIFFFNYRRINLSLKNPAYRTHLDRLFTPKRAEKLRALTENIVGDSPREIADEREKAIISELKLALASMGGDHSFDFRFRSPSGTRLLHCLVLVSKNFLAEKIWKEITAKESTSSIDGVPTHSFNESIQLSLGLSTPSISIDRLGADLVAKYRGTTTSLDEIMKDYGKGRNFVVANYREALFRLEDRGAIRINRNSVSRSSQQESRTLPTNCDIKFLRDSLDQADG